MYNALIYILFAAIPFWHLKIGAHITVYEVGLLINVIMAPLFHFRGVNKLRWLDVLVLIYAFYGIVSVAVGSNSFYESARTYRYLTLGPVLLYFIVRFTPASYDVIRRGLYFMAAGTLLQTLIVLRYVFIYKARPAGDAWIHFSMSGWVASIVTLGVLCSLAVIALIYTRNDVRRGFKRTSLYCAAVILGVGVFASATRMVVLVFTLLFPFAGRIWKKTRRRRRLGGAVYAAEILLFQHLRAQLRDKSRFGQSGLAEELLEGLAIEGAC